ncbi:MAG: PEP-CTERM sorting domain-containing protein [Microcoleaceae cyanobacterium]
MTIADGNIIFRVRGNENNLNQINPRDPKLSITPSLKSGTNLSLGDTGKLSDSISLDNSSTTLYNLIVEVVLESDPAESGDPLVRDQKVVASFTPGISDDVFSLVFDNNSQTIENIVTSAFTYDSIDDLWTVNQDTSLFTVTTSTEQEISTFTLNLSDSAKDQDVEAVPEPISILGTLTALGFGALLKRKRS